MKYEHLIQQFTNQPWIETSDVAVWFDEPMRQIQARISRWVQQGKLIQLMRGKYLLPEMYRKTKLNTYALSNALYSPSYISLETALEFYGIIPEAVLWYQSITSRQTKSWETELGYFNYQSVKQERFFGYEKVHVSNEDSFFCATPEKALVDLFYFGKGEWNEARIYEMRFQNLEKINEQKLKKINVKMNSKKVNRATEVFNRLRNRL